MNDDAELRALRWRCRRGMRELDQVLVRWLDREWPAASDAERAVFRRLLACEDDRLWKALVGQDRLDDPELQRFTEMLARAAH